MGLVLNELTKLVLTVLEVGFALIINSFKRVVSCSLLGYLRPRKGVERVRKARNFLPYSVCGEGHMILKMF